MTTSPSVDIQPSESITSEPESHITSTKMSMSDEKYDLLVATTIQPFKGLCRKRVSL